MGEEDTHKPGNKANQGGVATCFFFFFLCVLFIISSPHNTTAASRWIIPLASLL